MSFFFKEIINHKLKQLTVEDVLHYARQYGFYISRQEAADILAYVQTNDVDIFSQEAVEDAYEKIAEITDWETADKAKQLFEQLIKSYGLENFFQ